MKICILYGGISSERQISISSANSIYEAILDDYNIEMYDFTGDYVELLSKVEHVDLVFNALHGGDGENGIVQKFLEKNKIKFTGSNSLASKIAMNKIECKKICVENNIPTPKWNMYRKEKISLKKFLSKEETASRRFSYIPETKATVPPETPGTKSAVPMRSPLR